MKSRESWLLKTVALASFPSTSSTLGIGCTACNRVLLSGFKSAHSPHCSWFFTTIPAHHGVGWLTLEITPMASILSSSSFTFSWRDRGTFLGIHNGWYHLSLILYSPQVCLFSETLQWIVAWWCPLCWPNWLVRWGTSSESQWILRSYSLDQDYFTTWTLCFGVGDFLCELPYHLQGLTCWPS